jgi:hypothetical protein
MPKKISQTIPIFNEDAVCYALYKNFIHPESKVYFKLAHNLAFKNPRDWAYWCGPEIDVIEVRKDETIIAYELKGSRKYKDGTKDQSWPGLYDGIGQAVAYLNLPRVALPDNTFKFSGGAFDYVYLAHARPNLESQTGERELFDILPIGLLGILPDGIIHVIKNAPENPLRDKNSKKHFLENLDTIKKHSSVKGKIYQRIIARGSDYFQ